MPTKKRIVSPSVRFVWARIWSATPTSGERSHVVPSSVCGPGNAESPTIAIATYAVTTVPIARKSARGRSTPGRRASSARFATVSRPVNASIASGIANTSELTVGAVPSEVPFSTEPGETSSANPKAISTSWVSTSSAGTIVPSVYIEGRRTSRIAPTATIAPTPTTTSHGLRSSALICSAPAR